MPMRVTFRISIRVKPFLTWYNYNRKDYLKLIDFADTRLEFLFDQ
jgi:hypothetical protein